MPFQSFSVSFRYRGRVEAIRGSRSQILFVDFGNVRLAFLGIFAFGLIDFMMFLCLFQRDWVDNNASLAALPGIFHAQTPGAKEYTLALVQTPKQVQFRRVLWGGYGGGYTTHGFSGIYPVFFTPG